MTQQSLLGAVEWRYEETFRILGLDILVRASAEEAGRRLAWFFQSFRALPGRVAMPGLTLSAITDNPGNGSAPAHKFYENETLVAHAPSVWNLLRQTEIKLDQFLAGSVKESLLIHSGAASKDGRALFLPAASESGKTSLTLALVLDGWRYLSDEFAAVEAKTGMAVPFAKPVSIKKRAIFTRLSGHPWVGPDDDSAEGAVWYTHPSDFSREVSPPSEVRWVVFPQYRDGVRPRLERVNDEDALKRLIENSVNLNQVGARGLKIVSKLVRQADCYTLSAGPLDETRDLLARALLR